MLIFGCLKFLPPNIHRCWFLDVWNFIWFGGKKVDQWMFASLPWHSPRFDSSLWISRWGCAESLQVEQLLGGVFGSPMLFVTGAFCALFLGDGQKHLTVQKPCLPKWKMNLVLGKLIAPHKWNIGWWMCHREYSFIILYFIVSSFGLLFTFVRDNDG